MARSRNIKPSFFTNDAVAENDPLGRLLFIGLWTIADFKGELEWRPKRIKAQILPYDECDIVKLAINLDKSGFIRFYSVQGKSYVHIVNFTKHQNPHINEERKGSDVPVFDEPLAVFDAQVIDNEDVAINLDKSGLNRECSGTTPADSFILIPDPLNLIPLEKPLSSKPDCVEVIEYLNAVTGSKYKATTASHAKDVNGRLSQGHSVEDMKLVIDFKNAEWKDDARMSGYLRPATLFGASKFDGYLKAAKTVSTKQNGIHAVGKPIDYIPEGFN